MYHILFGISALKSMEPFFRKDVLQTLNNEEFLFINTLMISILIIAYTIYMYFTKKTILSRHEYIISPHIRH